jgi:hypothetical protein
MELYQTGFNPAQYEQPQQQQQGGGMGGMLGQMLGGGDWQSMLGNIDTENIITCCCRSWRRNIRS